MNKLGAWGALGIALWSSVARADGIDTPAAGTAQLGRAGAWLARADDPLAAFFNPAAMVRNPSGAHAGVHLLVRAHCFQRLGPDGAPVTPGANLNPATEPVCADIAPFPNPQIGVTYHFAPRWAVGLAVVGPHKHGKAVWPDVVQYANKFGVLDADHPSPQRYMILDDDALLAYPTLSVGFALLKNLSVGAGFVWGVAHFSFSNMGSQATGSASAGPPAQDDFRQDIRSKITGTDAFVPGFVASVLWSPTKRLDLAAWYRYSDAIRTAIDLDTQANYYPSGGTVVTPPKEVDTSHFPKAGTFKFQIPMEARLGLRYHHPRGRNPRSQEWVEKHAGYARDGMSQDLFDVEVDLSWSHNSAVQNIEIRMMEGQRINGTPGYVPTIADTPRQWNDIVGVRLGGEFVAIPDLLAIRTGGFFESKGVDAGYLSLDFHQGYKAGVAAGATLRLGRVDISAGYQHTFFGALDNGGNGQVHGLSGDATAGYRTPQVINGGRATAKLDEAALGVTVHF